MRSGRSVARTRPRSDSWRGSARRTCSAPRALGLEQALLLHGVISPVTEGVAAQKAPGGQDDSPPDPECADCIKRVARAGGLVLAAPGERRRDQALIDHDR